MVAIQQGAMRPDDEAGVFTVVWHMEKAAEKGWVDAFKVLLKEEENKLDNGNWQVFIGGALVSGKLDILSLEETTLAMSIMSPEDISSSLENILEARLSPFIANFFLERISVPADVGFAEPLVYHVIQDGSYGLFKVFLKHGLVNFDSAIDGHGYAEEGGYQNKIWNVTWLAAKLNRLNILRLLLDDPRSRDIEQLYYALIDPIRRGYVEAVRLMMNASPIEILKDGRRSSRDMNGDYLEMAVLSGSSEMVKVLLSCPFYHEPILLQDALVTAVNNDYTQIAVTLLSDPRLGSLSAEVRKRLVTNADFNGNAKLVRLLRAPE